jgi:hypothetical protein
MRYAYHTHKEAQKAPADFCAFCASLWLKMLPTSGAAGHEFSAIHHSLTPVHTEVARPSASLLLV